MSLQQSTRAWFTALILLPVSAFATDGYFQHGYGIIAQGMGGAATATAFDTFGGANNPASMVLVGNRVDAGLVYFSPRRAASRENAGPMSGDSESGNNHFFIPSFGYNHLLTDRLSLGVTVYGNGGMDTYYGSSATGAGTNLLAGQGKLGVDLQQLIVAPTLAFKLDAANSIGISPLLVYQQFKAYGLQAFGGMSSDASHLTNQGYDASTGAGVRVGWQGHLTDWLALGATYSPQTHMSKFDDYRGLFAQQGRFDLPENYTAGIAVTPIAPITLALDYQRINYSKVDSVGNSSHVMQPLGSSAGPGFGWQDINVIKLGVQFKANDKLTLRAGYNHSENPIRPEDVTFNILAPGVVEHHATLGATVKLPKGELSLSWMHAFSNEVSGASLAFGGTESIRMFENSVGVSYGLAL